MKNQANGSEEENSYFMDHESGVEMVRLLDQDRLFTKAMGGLLAERDNDFTGIERVLDVGCGPGGWVQEVAFAHPEREIVGIDLSQIMITYARAQARVQHLDNAFFQVMDIEHPLEFSDNSFDLVNARLLGFLSPSFWPTLMQEYLRVTRPHGLIRLTETEMSVSNSPALEQEMDWFFRSLWKAGQSFSSNESRLTITSVLAPLLRQAGCRHVEVKGHAIDWSMGAKAHEGMAKDMEMGFKLMEPFYQAIGIARQEERDQVYEQMLIEMQQETFGAVHYLLSVCGEKPEGER